MIYAIAATALNLLVGYTGLVSLGHALFVGIGAYAVGILGFHEIDNGWVQLVAGRRRDDPGRRCSPGWWCCAPRAWPSS